ncbi:MAG: O-antigen/teichoic acid export membrane protein [Neolewinella sp.]
MKHSVRSTLLCLGAGTILQRALQLLAFVIVGRTLGVAGLGIYAEGMAVAAMLAVLAGAGVRNLVARAISKQPQAARALVGHAVYMRLLLGLMLAILAVAIGFVSSVRPWFWLLCALHVVPAAFDLKNLVDAAGRTRSEVLLDSAAAVLQLVLIGVWALVDNQHLEVLAAISLACRCVYAAGAILQIRRLPLEHEPDQQPLGITAVGAGQTAHELLAIGDIALIALMCGDIAAGYYAVAVRFAAAALLPSTQLARLLLPHLLHAEQKGDSKKTFGTAMRATLWLTAPICAGGLVVADSLCALSGPEFAMSGHVLRLLLFAGICQHVGWQCSHSLLASQRDRSYAHGLGWPAVFQACALLALIAVPNMEAAMLATLAATAAAVAQAVYLVNGLSVLKVSHAFLRSLGGPLLAAAATAGAASLPVEWLAPQWQLPARICFGAAGYGIVLWLFELRGRLTQVGDGLATASGFND